MYYGLVKQRLINQQLKINSNTPECYLVIERGRGKSRVLDNLFLIGLKICYLVRKLIRISRQDALLT